MSKVRAEQANDDPIEISISMALACIEMSCGHLLFMAQGMLVKRKQDHKPYWCTYCGQSDHFPEPT